MTDPQLSFALPDSNSQQVQYWKNKLEGANTIKQLTKELKQVDIAACLASNAACASGDLNRWIKTRDVLKQLEAIYGNCAITTAEFSADTQSVMNNLEIVFQMLQEGQEKTATKFLEKSSTIAKNCQEKAQKLAEDIRKDIGEVDKFKEETIKQKNKTNESQKEREKKLKQAEQNFKVREPLVQAELKGYEDEIDKLTKDYETAKKVVHDKQEKKATMWSTGAIENDIQRAETQRKEIDEKLERAKENKKQSQHDLNELWLQKKHDDIDIDEDEIDITKCLEQVFKGLGQMVQTLGKTASFWEQVSRKSGRLGKSDLQGTIKDIIGLYDKDWWKNWWQQNPAMKRIAIEHYAEWLALHDVCQEFENQVHTAQMGAWNLLGEAPTREEGRKKVEEIFKQLSDTQK